ncbi:ABC transporter substrate-binding protein [Dongshaea marina]|uniref:ABC transporter substrate-binding protein n=1 Tax=Dongshaea marina TaxID=2047966 RepID=UPI000D3EC1BF|nr:sugar ABC transporter [Dongshaea marina]
MGVLTRVICLAICLLLPGATNGQVKHRVLVIESYHAEYPWDASYKEGLQSELGSDYQLDFFEMDTKRLARERHLQRANAAWEHYQQTKPDLVILGDDNAIRFLGPLLAQNSVPVVYLGLNNNPRDYSIYGAPNITGVLERPLIKRSIASASQFFTPHPKRILLLLDSGQTSETIYKEIFNDQPNNTFLKISVDVRLVGSWERWQKLVKQSKKQGYDLLFVGLFHTLRNHQNQHIPAQEVLQWTSTHTPIPPLGLWDFAVGKDKTIGGLVLYGKEQGITAAWIARQILEQGVSPGKIHPVPAEKGRYLFSRSQLEKWNTKLPDFIETKAQWVD